MSITHDQYKQALETIRLYFLQIQKEYEKAVEQNEIVSELERFNRWKDFKRGDKIKVLRVPSQIKILSVGEIVTVRSIEITPRLEKAGRAWRLWMSISIEGGKSKSIACDAYEIGEKGFSFFSDGYDFIKASG